MARRRGSGGDSGGDSSRWLTTYGDAVTLLLAFFVMMYAISQVDVQKFQLLVSGLADPFKNSSAVEGILTTGSGIVGLATTTNTTAPQAFDRITISPKSPTGGATTEGQEGGATEGTGTAGAEQELVGEKGLEDVSNAIQDAVSAAGIEYSVSLSLDTRGLVVSIATDEVLFPLGSAEVQPLGRKILNLVAPILADFGNEVRIEGHTDTIPLNRNGYTNWNLSADRALAVLNILQNEYGLDPRRLSATGYGEHRPVDANDTPEGRQHNRRVELVIVAANPED